MPKNTASLVSMPTAQSSISAASFSRNVRGLQVSVRQRAMKVMQLVAGDAAAVTSVPSAPAATANGHQQPVADLLGPDTDAQSPSAAAAAAAAAPDLLGESLHPGCGGVRLSLHPCPGAGQKTSADVGTRYCTATISLQLLYNFSTPLPRGRSPDSKPPWMNG